MGAYPTMMVSPDADAAVLAYLIFALVGLSAGLYLIPMPCRCKECQFHIRQRKAAVEAKRVRDHKMLHHTYNIPWGDAVCAQCRLGHGDDQHRR